MQIFFQCCLSISSNHFHASFLNKYRRFISNDNIHFPDLSDEVHLNAAGVAKLYRHISSALRLYERGGEVSV